MGYESNTGLGVFNHYGPRGTEDGVVSGGELAGGEGSIKEGVIYITGDDFDGGLNFNTQLILPAGSFVQEAFIEVSEAFTLGNADNIFSVGTDTSEATNGITIANPDATGNTQEMIGDLNGTWASALAADTTVGVACSGTTASVAAGAGKAKVVIRYRKI